MGLCGFTFVERIAIHRLPANLRNRRPQERCRDIFTDSSSDEFFAPEAQCRLCFWVKKAVATGYSAKRMVPYFFVGSSKEDVYRVQGIPDWSNEQEWRYGDSRVYFAGNGVQSWKSGTKVPLKVIELGHARKERS